MKTETAKQRPASRYAAHAGETETWIDVAAPSCTEAEKLHAVYSAAPELLEALEWLVEFFDKYPPYFSNGCTMSVDLDDLNDAHAAIAKARGQQ